MWLQVKFRKNTQFTKLNPQKAVALEKKRQKLHITLKIVPKYKLLHVKPIQKIIRNAVIFKISRTENSTVV